jgi:hypothetical protein
MRRFGMTIALVLALMLCTGCALSSDTWTPALTAFLTELAVSTADEFAATFIDFEALPLP